MCQHNNCKLNKTSYAFVLRVQIGKIVLTPREQPVYKWWKEWKD